MHLLTRLLSLGTIENGAKSMLGPNALAVQLPRAQIHVAIAIAPNRLVARASLLVMLLNHDLLTGPLQVFPNSCRQTNRRCRLRSQTGS